MRASQLPPSSILTVCVREGGFSSSQQPRAGWTLRVAVLEKTFHDGEAKECCGLPRRIVEGKCMRLVILLLSGRRCRYRSGNRMNVETDARHVPSCLKPDPPHLRKMGCLAHAPRACVLRFWLRTEGSAQHTPARPGKIPVTGPSLVIAWGNGPGVILAKSRTGKHLGEGRWAKAR